MHGQFPFPEATATTEVLVAGEAGGQQAKILLRAAAVGGLYDFLVSGVGAWREVVTTKVFGWGQMLADKVKLEFRLNIGAAVLGLGYIVGLRYATIIAAGSFLAWWVLIPLVYFIGQYIPGPILQSKIPISQMLPEQIFGDYVRHVGIGGIAAAGIIGIIKSRKIIAGAFKLAASEIFGKSIAAGGPDPEESRLQLDIKMKWIVTTLVAAVAGIFVFFLTAVVGGNVGWAAIGAAIVVIIAFLFTTVAARAIAIVGTNPVSGMTLMTLIISSVILVSVGLKGDQGMLAALIIGGVVCTALSMAGGFITDLKIGYWLGTTPRTQERWKFLGTLFAAASVGVVILVLYKTYGFGPGGLEAPQASAMAAVLKPLMSNQPAPWLAYLAGAILAVILEMLKVPPLAFALGMYLPLHLNTPILAGGIIAHLVSTRSKERSVNDARRERGTLIASGFIAGGAIMGVVSAFIVFFGKQLFNPEWTLMKAIGTEQWDKKIPSWVNSSGAEILGFVMFAIIMIYMYIDSKRAAKG